MLFQQRFLVGIRNGDDHTRVPPLAPPDRALGRGTLLTSIGELVISSVSETTLGHISSQDANPRRLRLAGRAAGGVERASRRPDLIASSWAHCDPIRAWPCASRR